MRQPRESRPREDDFRRGATAAADVADGYNASTTHPHRLGDVILAKLNLRRGRPRRNERKIETDQGEWERGFAAGLLAMHGRLLHGADPVGVREAARAAQLTIADFRRAGVAASDLRRLRRTGIPAR